MGFSLLKSSESKDCVFIDALREAWSLIERTSCVAFIAGENELRPQPASIEGRLRARREAVPPGVRASVWRRTAEGLAEGEARANLAEGAGSLGALDKRRRQRMPYFSGRSGTWIAVDHASSITFSLALPDNRSSR